jgi:hypothetical protein
MQIKTTAQMVIVCPTRKISMVISRTLGMSTGRFAGSGWAGEWSDCSGSSMALFITTIIDAECNPGMSAQIPPVVRARQDLQAAGRA